MNFYYIFSSEYDDITTKYRGALYIHSGIASNRLEANNIYMPDRAVHRYEVLKEVPESCIKRLLPGYRFGTTLKLPEELSSKILKGKI